MNNEKTYKLMGRVGGGTLALGSVRIPEVLRPYMGGMTEIR